jgi:hypothetical protein
VYGRKHPTFREENMRRRVSLVALAGVVALGLFGCGGGGYDTATGFAGMEVALSGQYQVLSKDPGVLPNFYSLQLYQSGKSLEAIDNLGQTWKGQISNLTYYGVYPTGSGQQDTSQQPTQPGQQPGQQQTTTEPESFHGEIYLMTQSAGGTITMTGVIETYSDVTLPTTDPTQQATSSARTAIAATVVDTHRGASSGSVFLYNIYGQAAAQTTP